MAPFPGFIGGSSQAQSVSVDAQRSINLYPEIVESGSGRSQTVLYGTPGLEVFCTLPEGPVRSLFEQNGLVTVVAGSGFYELTGAGFAVHIGDVHSDGHPATQCSNGKAGGQRFITSGGHGYIYDLDDRTLTEITDDGFPLGVVMGGFRDGYFMALGPNGVQISTLEDGSTWDASDIGQRSQRSDGIDAMLLSHTEQWFWGPQSAEVWYDNGAAGFPFAPIPNAVLEVGIAAPASAALFDQAPAWLSQDARGGVTVRRADGFNPSRISTHAIEAAWAQYPTVSDAVAYVYQEQGHEFYVLNFPTAKATWVCDAATKYTWHERAYLNPSTGVMEAHRGICHCYAFGKHLIGDRANGKVYRQALGLYDDAGDPMRSERRAPHVSVPGKTVFYNRLELITEPGVGTVTGQGVAPVAMLRWSNDAGKTFGNEVTAPLGPLGDYGYGVAWERLGRSRSSRVFSVAITDPVKRVLIDADLDVTVGTH